MPPELLASGERRMVTQMLHADALRYRWRDLLTLAGLSSGPNRLPARRVTFRAGEPIPAGSYCR